MSNKFVYQNAQIKSRESKLLTLQAEQRLFDAQNLPDALKVLVELGYGSGADADGVDAIFEKEEENLLALLNEMNVDGALDAFYADNDFLNLKTALKAYATGSKGVYLPSGLVKVEDIILAVETDDSSAVFAQMKSAIELAKPLIADEKGVDPRKIDCIVDKKAYEYKLKAAKKCGKTAKEYFERKIDFANVGSFFRCRKLHLPVDFFKEGFIDGGKVSVEKYEEIYDLPLDALCELYKGTHAEREVLSLVESGNIVAFEKESDDALLKIWKDEASDMFSVAPIVSYYLTKKTELKNVKLIVAGIKNKVPEKTIKERMRELYA